MEQDLKKNKLKEKEEEEKRQKMKDDVINSALKQMQFKEMKKKEEEANDAKYKEKLLEKYAQDEQLEKEKQKKQREQLIEIQNAIQKQREEKYNQYQKQREKEMDEYNKLKQEEDAKKYIIEQEKLRLLKENEDKSSSYPQYGKVKNFVYDINIQDVNPNINKINYPMYNATANNNYDSYPSPEEYKKMMEKVGQKNYAYAGGEFIEGVPFRGQRPVFIKNGIKNNLRPLNDIGINNNEIRYRNKKLDEYGMNTIGIKKPSTGYYKTEGNYNMNNININKEKVEENKYYLNKVPEAI